MARAGLVNDRFGATITSLIGAVLTSVGYAGMSYTNKVHAYQPCRYF